MHSLLAAKGWFSVIFVTGQSGNNITVKLKLNLETKLAYN